MNLEFVMQGYDTFIGREIIEGGDHTSFVSLSLHGGGSVSIQSVEGLCDYLCMAVREEERILFIESPGSVDARTCDLSHALRAVEGFLLDNGVGHVVLPPVNQEQKIIPARRYQVLEPDEIQLLMEMYKAVPGMEQYPNPFLLPPRAH